MTSISEQATPHMARFLSILDAAFRRYGEPGGLPDRIRDAVAATPRHMFVHRFRPRGGPLDNRAEENTLRDSDADPEGTLAEIYSDAVMTHVDSAGAPLPSTNSQPSYVLWLLHLLRLEPGQRMLEIGSGSGWLAAVMARLVGETGRVTGIEVLPELAAQSRADLHRLGLHNVAVYATDGAQGHAAGAPYDRAMITAAVWDVPVALWEQVTEGGRVLVPVELRGGGCQVTVLRRAGDRFVGEKAVPGWFVPLLGPAQRRPELRVALEALSFWAELGGVPSQNVPLPLAVGPGDAAGSAVAAFRAFLGRVAPGFSVFGAGEPPEQRPWLPAEPFGIVDEASHSVALWRSGELIGYGGVGASRTLARAYADWTTCGLPGLAGLSLEVVRAGPEPSSDGRSWVEPRSGTALLWRPLPRAEAWRELCDDGGPQS